MDWTNGKILLKIIFIIQVMRSCEGLKLKDDEVFFLNFDKDYTEYNHKVSELAWSAMLDDSNVEKQLMLEDLASERLQFVNRKCQQMLSIKPLDASQQRMFDLTCSGLKFDNDNEQRKLLELSSMIQFIYTTTKLCLPKSIDICNDADKLWNFTYVHDVAGFKRLLFTQNDEIQLVDVSMTENQLNCYSGEPQLEKLMENDYTSLKSHPDTSACMRNRDLINYWAWETWRHSIGPKIRELYPKLINSMNLGAEKAGYMNVGEMWQREMEIDDVVTLMQTLMTEIQPFYNMLHAFVKSILEKRYKIDGEINDNNIPAHYLGWNANWNHLLKDYIEPKTFPDQLNIDVILDARKWTSHDAVKRIEDFYTSLGLGKMTKAFWDESYISNDINASCHGTAANMFKENDFRMIVCGFKSIYDFYVITHEIGHVEQYMLSQTRPAAFRPGNSIIQETIGDSIFLAMMTPMHLSRLRLIDELSLFPPLNQQSNLHQLMTMALMKIPDIPFGYVLENFRYNLFAKRIDMEHSNDYFWDLTRKYQRIEPPNIDINRHQLFDVAAKFHFAANIPYAKYFFANILQYQVFRGLCEVTVYGKVKGNETLGMDLHKCDIYGSRRAGKLLRRSLHGGSEMNFKTILKSLTGSETVSASALIEYYHPLIKFLQNYLKQHKIQY